MAGSSRVRGSFHETLYVNANVSECYASRARFALRSIQHARARSLVLLVVLERARIRENLNCRILKKSLVFT